MTFARTGEAVRTRDRTPYRAGRGRRELACFRDRFPRSELGDRPKNWIGHSRQSPPAMRARDRRPRRHATRISTPLTEEGHDGQDDLHVNFPVKDLAAATRFYEAIRCRKSEKFSDHQSASMIWSDAINFQLLTRDYFATFTSKQVADALPFLPR